jgi:hypothetical protein
LVSEISQPKNSNPEKTAKTAQKAKPFCTSLQIHARILFKPGGANKKV